MLGPDEVEAGLVALLIVLVCLPIVRAIWRVRASFLAVFGTGLWVAVTVTLAFGIVGFRAPRVPESEVKGRPVVELNDGFVSSEACKSCHPHEYETWQTSYHSTMTQLATPENVLGDFDGVDLEWRGNTYRLEEEGDELFVELADPLWQGAGPAPRIRRRVVVSTGSHHDQNYWYEGNGNDRRLVLLPFDYSRREERWIPFQSTFILPPDLPWTKAQGRWNTTCGNCHATAPRTRVLQTTRIRQGSVDTRVAEFGIACESCHGRAEEHVRQNQNPMRRFGQYLFGDQDESIVNPARLNSKRSSEVCGSCHGVFIPRPSVRRQKIDAWTEEPWSPGEDIHESRIYIQHRYKDPSYFAEDSEKHSVIQRLEEADPPYSEGRFWSDGMVRVSGRDFSGMMEAPCYERGEMDCLSCHQLHQSRDDPRPSEEWANDMLRHDKTDNRACTGCHPEFAATENLTAHTRHAAGSTGSSCYNCHMSYTVYGIQKAIRSHHVDTPSVATSISTGRPNACNQCHLDKTLAWTAEHLSDGYGIRVPEMSQDQREVAASILWALEGDAGQRALMAWSFGWEPAMEASGSLWMAPYLSHLLADPYDSVRFIANQSIRKHDGYSGFEYDFLLPTERQYDATFRARMIWDSRPAFTDGKARPAVLHDARGSLDYSKLKRHASRRDDHRMILHE